MFQMRVYSERISAANGILTNVGEDAYPFVNNAGMFVADGMGGGAGVPIIRFDEKCFDKDSLSRILCDYFKFESSEAEEEFCKYSKENFSSLSNSIMEDLYRNPKSNSLRLKKSGYVGSHALGAVFAALLIHLSSRLCYPEFDFTSWKETVEKYRVNLFSQYKNVIEVLGSECARVNIDKIDYYGTTMAGVFFKENDDSVDAIFLNCGDSRSYVWDSNGFRQACDDQGRNGGMTNRFSLGKDAIVDISCVVRNYKKPCSIFCMTDGFYGVFGGKNGFHSSPLYMEGFLMNVFSTQLSIEDATSRLKAVFDAKGQIDDSNSMVMASFGYSNYEELRDAAKLRMDYLNQEYGLASMPEDFLIVDYNKIVSDLQESSAGSIKPLLEEAYGDEKVKLYCLNQIDQPLNAVKYKQEVKKIDDKIENVESENNEINKTLKSIVKENFIDFVNIEAIEQPLITKLSNMCKGTRPKDAHYYGQLFHDDHQSRSKAINDFAEEIALLNSTITSNIGSVTINIEVPWTRSTEEDTVTWVRTTKECIKELIRKSQDKLTDIIEYSRRITYDRDQWTQINMSLMNDYLNIGGEISPQKIVNDWTEDALAIEKAVNDTTIPSVRYSVIKFVKNYNDNLEQVKQLKMERSQAVEKAAYQYWVDNSSKDIHKLLKNDIYFVSNPLLKQQFIDLFSQNEELTKYEYLAKKQDEVFDKYLKMHLLDTSEDKISDVKKNGWM